MRLGLVIALMLFPVAGLAQDVPPERVEAFLAVMAENGCRMDNATADEVMPKAGFDDKDEVKTIVGMLMAEERASLIDGQVIVHGGSCGTTAPDYTTRERFLAGVAYNGCKMTAEQSNALLPPLGIERNAVKPLIGQMMAMGEVSLSSDNKTVYLEQSLCDAFDGMAEKIAGDKMIEAVKTAERVKFIKYMEKSGCQMSHAGFRAAIADEGFNSDLVYKVINDLSDEGLLLYIGDGFVLTEGDCF